MIIPPARVPWWREHAWIALLPVVGVLWVVLVAYTVVRTVVRGRR